MEATESRTFKNNLTEREQPFFWPLVDSRGDFFSFLFSFFPCQRHIRHQTLDLFIACRPAADTFFFSFSFFLPTLFLSAFFFKLL